MSRKSELLTPVGLRSLSPNHPDYKPIYDGDLRSRDGAYHQGTVWAWLIGPFIDAWLKVHPDENASARKFLERFPEHERSRARHDQRSVRCPRTAHRRRLHRPGLERGGSVALLGEDGVIGHPIHRSATGGTGAVTVR